MKKRRNSWIYPVLGVMLFSLITVSALPLVGSVVEGQQFARDPNSETITLSQQELTKLEAEASGYQKVLEREPNNDTALNGLLNIKLRQKDIEGAIAPLSQLAKLHPEQTEYGILLAQAEQQIADYEAAAAAYEGVLAEHPGNIYALGGITDLYLAQEQPEKAIALLKKTVNMSEREDEPVAESIDRAAVELLLGELYATRERYGEAIALYEELANADPDDFRPILAKALVLEKQGDLNAAQPLLEKAYVAAPADYKDRIGEEMERIVSQIESSESEPKQSDVR